MKTSHNLFANHPLPAALGLGLALTVVGSACADTLFLDTFAVDSNQSDVNYQYNAPGRQSGSLGALTYSQSPAAGNFRHQVGHSDNPGALLLAGTDAWQNGTVSPDHNFVEVGTLNISFDLNAGGGGWVGLSLGATDPGARLQWVNDANSHFGLLFESGTGFQAFDANTQLSLGTYRASGGGWNHVEIQISGDNPWDGGDAQISAFVDGNNIFSFTKTGGYADDYITLMSWGYWNVGFIDNLQVSVTPVPEPSSLALLGFGGLAVLWRRCRSKK